jgi:hypothetical protein
VTDLCHTTNEVHAAQQESFTSTTIQPLTTDSNTSLFIKILIQQLAHLFFAGLAMVATRICIYLNVISFSIEKIHSNMDGQPSKHLYT